MIFVGKPSLPCLLKMNLSPKLRLSFCFWKNNYANAEEQISEMIAVKVKRLDRVTLKYL